MRFFKNHLRAATGITLAIVLMAGLTACGGNGGTPAVTPTPNPSTPAPAATPVPETPVEPEQPDTEEIRAEAGPEVRDMGGRAFNFLAWYNFLNDGTDRPEPDPATSDDYVGAMMAWENLQSLKNDYNCTVTGTVVGSVDVIPTLTTSVMAGDGAYDLVLLQPRYFFMAVMGNLIMSLDEYVPADADVFNRQLWLTPASEYNGKNWTMFRRYVEDEGQFLGVNMDIIRSIGAEDPCELYDRGEWTFEKFREICKLATRDTTGDNIIDQFGVSGVPNYLLYELIAANDGVLVKDDWTVGLSDPKTMTALELGYNIFNVDKTFYFDADSGADFMDWERNYYAFEDGRTAFFVVSTWALEDVSFDYAAVPFPKGPDNNKGYTHFFGVSTGAAVPRGTKNPTDVYYVYEKVNAWYGDDLDYALEGDTDGFINSFLTEEDGLRMLDDLTNHKKFDYAMLIDENYEETLGHMAEDFVTGTATVAQAVESYRQEMQDILNEVNE